MKLTLKKITADNYEEVGKLYLPEDQQVHLSANIWSIADSKFDDSYEARAIYNNKTLAEALYQSVGLKENGMDEEGEEKLAIIDMRNHIKA